MKFKRREMKLAAVQHATVNLAGTQPASTAGPTGLAVKGIIVDGRNVTTESQCTHAKQTQTSLTMQCQRSDVFNSTRLLFPTSLSTYVGIENYYKIRITITKSVYIGDLDVKVD